MELAPPRRRPRRRDASTTSVRSSVRDAGATAAWVEPAIDADESAPARRAPELHVVETEAAPGRLRRATAAVARVRTPLIAYGASRATVLAVAVFASIIHPHPEHGHEWPRVPGPLVGWLQVLGRWDGAWYIRVATHWYSKIHYRGSAHASVAFFPGYPMVVRAAHTVLFMPTLIAAVLVATALGGVAAVLAWKLVREISGADAARRAVWLFCFAPGAFVFSMAYSEAMFLTATIGVVLYLVRRQWVTAGVLAAVATATRPNGFVVAALCAAIAVVALRERRPDGTREWRALWAPALAPLGTVGYFTYLQLRFHHWHMWFDVQRNGWGDQTDPIGGFTTHLHGVLRHFMNLRPAGLNDGIWFLGLFASIGLMLALWKWRPPLPVLVYGALSVAFALTSLRVGLRPRMILIAFPLVLAPGVVLRGRAYRALLGASAVLLVALSFATFVSLAATP